ncbi:hypothetical protein HYV49_04690 [Candidatus Pacearchaeota archaeon]|nr:hypothetical protein [Candidatus Pacearchaeota archaeon]
MEIGIDERRYDQIQKEMTEEIAKPVLDYLRSAHQNKEYTAKGECANAYDILLVDRVKILESGPLLWRRIFPKIIASISILCDNVECRSFDQNAIPQGELERLMAKVDFDKIDLDIFKKLTEDKERWH